MLFFLSLEREIFVSFINEKKHFISHRCLCKTFRVQILLHSCFAGMFQQSVKKSLLKLDKKCPKL